MNCRLPIAGCRLPLRTESSPKAGTWAATFLLALLLCGCATSRSLEPASQRCFNFQTDAFAFSNELVWKYYFDARGKWTSKRREPPPDYSHHCFVVVRSAAQFFEHARFDPAQPVADANTYRRLIRQVVHTSLRRDLPESEKISIPGYANLRDFSGAQAKLLQAECGSAWQSYFQRGHWRMVFPFSRRHQAKMADELTTAVKHNRPAVVHVVQFPKLSINHAVLVFGAIEAGEEISFAVYDPNNCEKPATLTYNRARRTFYLPSNDYFHGGVVDVYEIYRGFLF